MEGAAFLEGDRIDLKTLERSDVEFVQQKANREEMRRPLFGHSPVNLEQEEEFYEETLEDGFTALIITGEDERIGLVSLRAGETGENAEITVWIKEGFRGEHRAEEAVRLILGHGFEELDYHRIHARILGSNEASKNLFEKLGFQHEGTKREAFYTEGDYKDVELYSLLQQEWFSREG